MKIGRIKLILLTWIAKKAPQTKTARSLRVVLICSPFMCCRIITLLTYWGLSRGVSYRCILGDPCQDWPFHTYMLICSKRQLWLLSSLLGVCSSPALAMGFILILFSTLETRTLSSPNDEQEKKRTILNIICCYCLHLFTLVPKKWFH